MQHFILEKNEMRSLLFTAALMAFSVTAVSAQDTQRAQPTWWIGAAAGANLNFYDGTTQMLNPALTTPAPFHKGFGAGLYLAPLVEYRPDSIWGGMLQIGYDNRSGSFNDIICPCGEVATLSAKISYLSIEPSLRVAPFAGGFYVYAGPRIGFSWGPNLVKSSTKDENTFEYTQQDTTSTKGEFSGMKGVVFSGQIGMGYDLPLTDPSRRTQVEFSPFVSFQPYFGENPRSVESWNVSTLRVGAALKFGRSSIISSEGVAPNSEVQFSVRAPKVLLAKRRVRETFPLRNYVFFDTGSAQIPGRYVLLTTSEASGFREEQLQEVQPKNMTGRSLRQMTVYYNILNILGDRLKRNPGTSILLSGASEKGSEQGRARAEAVKLYLVNIFGIDASRIVTQGRVKPEHPSEEPGATQQLDLLRAGDNRVDIESESPEMLVQVGGASHDLLRPVQIVAEVEDPLDTHVFFNVVGATKAFTTWSLDITDDQGKLQHFGPFTGDRETIAGNLLLGDRSQGDYQVVMVGQAVAGGVVRKEASVHLIRRDEPVKEAVRFSILFDFDQSKTVDSYKTFLTDMVVPLIPDSSNVIIHGYTDVIGGPAYNENLSNQRVEGMRSLLESALSKKGKSGVTFEALGFGEDSQNAPFDNVLPEERAYNRTVIIDIVPN